VTTVGEGLVEAIFWYADGPHAPVPPSIAAMGEKERDRLWKSAEKLFRERGHDYAMGVAEGVIQHLSNEEK
jgi:hypothetical protein